MLICPKKKEREGRERFQTDMYECEGVIPRDNVTRERGRGRIRIHVCVL